MTLTIRPATFLDGPMLHEWRNDKGTREASHSTEAVALEDHMQWLETSLRDPRRTLLIVEENEAPVGSVRADHNGQVTRLSWTVAPDARGRKLATRMVQLAMHQMEGPYRAEVRKSNTASLRVAAGIGLEVTREEDGFVYFESVEPKQQDY